MAKRKDWLEFEKSVAAFLAALDATARVTHNVRLPDRDTGRARQRDVWIEASLGGHIPITVLVSCKRQRAKLDQQDIDAFLGELHSSGANKGVIYSYSGFRAAALEKAAMHRVSCCVLLENSPITVPDRLLFVWYCFAERVQASISGSVSGYETFNQVFDIRAAEGQSFLSAAIERHHAKRAELLAQLKSTVPVGWTTSVQATDGINSIQIDLIGSWRTFVARQEATMLSGSYSFTDHDFKGTIASPVIDLHSSHPGPGWIEVDDERLVATSADFFVGSLFLHGGPMEAQLREQVGHTRIREPTPAPTA